MRLINESKIEVLSKNNQAVHVYQKIIKLNEESGEVCQAFLEMDGSKNVSKSAESSNPVIKVIEECGDVINVALDIIYTLEREHNISRKEIENLFDKKLNKWGSKQNNC